MRAHKYRAWYNGQMYFVNDLSFSSIGVKIATLVNTSPNRSEDEKYIYQTDDIRSIELMQYTGLKDKSEKHGCESDLVKMFERSLFQIVWDDYYARFQLELVKGNEHAKIHNMGMLQFGEIVGNIHEHPRLLEVE